MMKKKYVCSQTLLFKNNAHFKSFHHRSVFLFTCMPEQKTQRQKKRKKIGNPSK